MGTIIALELAGYSLTSSKNHMGIDHGSLFQEADRRAIRSVQVNYDSFQEHCEDPSPMEMAFARPLRHIVPRLELLGFTMEQARRAYERCVVQWMQRQEAVREWKADAEPDPKTVPEPMSFDEFCAFATRQPIVDLDDTADYDVEDFQRPFGRFVEEAALTSRVPRNWGYDELFWSERSYFGKLIDIIDPYLLLRVLAAHPGNMEEDVVWQYGPLADAGYAPATAFKPSARRTETFLVATEGSSDANVLRHAFFLLRPEVSDFFRFIDVRKGYPFTGAGNLLKFAKGLANIDVQNQTLLVFDNDAEGVEAFGDLASVALPPNMRAMVLPPLDAFRSFRAWGPQGDHEADINGRAAAIECYLDHRLRDYPEPRVIWSNFKDKSGVYQGALEHKDSYTRAFMDLTPETIDTYDVGKIGKVLDAVIAECVQIASAASEARLLEAEAGSIA